MQLKPLIFALGIALSPASQAASLGEIYREALVNDTQYAAARAAYQAGLEVLPQARSALLPNVSADGNARYNDVRTTLPDGDTQRGNGALNLNAVQSLYNKADSVRVQQAEEQVKIVGKQLQLAGQDLILRTARMPSVLLEAGSIIHRDEEVLMGTEEHQLQIAGAVTEAVEHFCATRPSKTQRAQR